MQEVSRNQTALQYLRRRVSSFYQGWGRSFTKVGLTAVCDLDISRLPTCPKYKGFFYEGKW